VQAERVPSRGPGCRDSRAGGRTEAGRKATPKRAEGGALSLHAAAAAQKASESKMKGRAKCLELLRRACFCARETCHMLPFAFGCFLAARTSDMAPFTTARPGAMLNQTQHPETLEDKVRIPASAMANRRDLADLLNHLQSEQARGGTQQGWSANSAILWPRENTYCEMRTWLGFKAAAREIIHS